MSGLIKIFPSVAADNSFQQQNIDFSLIELLVNRFSNKILLFS